MNQSIFDKCEKIMRAFDGGGSGGAVTSVNGMTGDVIVKTYETFPSSWRSAGVSMNDLCSDIADTDPEEGRCFLGGIASMNPMPPNFPPGGNIEVIVQIPVRGVYVFSASSTDTFPYHWIGTGQGNLFNGWKSILSTDKNFPSQDGSSSLNIVKNGDDFTYTWVKTLNLFNSSTSYNIGDWVSYNGVPYVCKIASAGSWDSTKWEDMSALSAMFSSTNTSLSSAVSAKIQSICAGLNPSTSSIADVINALKGN